MKYYYSLEYIPEAAGRTRNTLECERMLSDFLNGDVPEQIFANFAKLARRVSAGKVDKWEICFVPASDDQATISRYSDLAARLHEATGIRASVNSIRRLSQDGPNDPEPRFQCSTGEFSGRNVILVDALVNRGRTINAAAAALLGAGALSVTGLVAAKTVAPTYAA